MQDSNRLEVGFWYEERNPKKLVDTKYLYKCTFKDPKVAVLEKYLDGACISSFSTMSDTKKYSLSNNNSLSQRVQFYKKDRFNTICDISELLLDISQKINTIEDLDRYLEDWSRRPEYSLTHDASESDKLYEEIKASIVDFNQIEQIKNFFSRS